MNSKFNQMINKVLIICILLISTNASAQVMKFVPKSSKMVIEGTSNLHDWVSTVHLATGHINIFGTAKTVQTVNVDIPVKAIKSDEEVMNEKTYEAFKADKHPTISFRVLEVNSQEIINNVINLTVTGNLTMAGVTRKITLKTTGKPNGSNYNFTGAVSLKMTDFNMTPPTAMMGMIKVANAVTIRFDIAVEGVDLSGR